jgi:hypothetical protein
MGPALGGFAKAIAWVLGAVTQAGANLWDRLTRHASREAEQIVNDDETRGSTAGEQP